MGLDLQHLHQHLVLQVSTLSVPVFLNQFKTNASSLIAPAAGGLFGAPAPAPAGGGLFGAPGEHRSRALVFFLVL